LKLGSGVADSRVILVTSSDHARLRWATIITRYHAFARVVMRSGDDRATGRGDDVRRDLYTARMSRYTQMVTAVGQARDRIYEERKRAGAVHEWILRALSRELGVDRDVIRDSGVLPSSHYLHQFAEASVFKTSLSIRIQDDDPMVTDPGETFIYEVAYGVGPSHDPRNAAVSVDIGGTSMVVKDENSALEVAQEMVRGIEAVLRIGNAQAKIRPTFGR
jgi:hypothetical protein